MLESKFSCWGKFGNDGHLENECKEACGAWRACRTFAKYARRQAKRQGERLVREISVDPDIIDLYNLESSK